MLSDENNLSLAAAPEAEVYLPFPQRSFAYPAAPASRSIASKHVIPTGPLSSQVIDSAGLIAPNI
jgi:hypothetical protein